jgi:hypothetical protein
MQELRSCDEVGERGRAVWYTCWAHCWMGWKKCIDNRRQSVARVVKSLASVRVTSAVVLFQSCLAMGFTFFFALLLTNKVVTKSHSLRLAKPVGRTWNE